jgi:hypothetical protein
MPPPVELPRFTMLRVIAGDPPPLDVKLALLLPELALFHDPIAASTQPCIVPSQVPTNWYFTAVLGRHPSPPREPGVMQPCAYMYAE